MAYYTATGAPINSSRGASALIRAEFVLIQTGFTSAETATGTKMPLAGGTFTGPVTFNGSATAAFGAAATFTSSATFTGGAVSMSGATSVTVPTLVSSDSSTNAASTAFVQAVAFITALPAQAGNSGKFVTTDGSNASWQEVDVTPPFSVKTANYTTASGDKISADTITTGAFTLTLPASPVAGDWVEIIDGGSGYGFATNNLTVARNGSTIEGAAENMTCSTWREHFTLVYTGGTWRYR